MQKFNNDTEIRNNNKEVRGRKDIVKILYGSHLYGTNGPNSDIDYTSVFMPSINECVLGKIPRVIKKGTKTNSHNSRANTKDDIDHDCFSLQFFLLNLGMKGETVFLDMIHAPDKNIIESSDEWEIIRENKSKFYTKNSKAYVGYCRNQAAKYGVKGSRLEAVENTLKFLKNSIKDNKKLNIKIKDIWNDLPEGKHIEKIHISTASNNQGQDAYQVCGRKIMEDMPIEKSIVLIENIKNEYGKRAIKAKQDGGIDWKAISHALRAAYQLEEILTTGNLIYPLKQADFLKKVKYGEMDYIKDSIAETLEDMIDKLETLSNNSSLPEEVDITFWEEFIKNRYDIEIEKTYNLTNQKENNLEMR